MNIASLILRPDLGFFALTALQSFKRPSLSFGSSSRISLRRQSFSVSRLRLRPPGNIHNRSRLLLTNKIRPRFAAMSFDDFAITVPHRLTTNSSVWFYMMFLDKKIKVSALPSRGSTRGNHQQLMSEVGQSRKLARLNGMFVLPSPADVVGPPRHVRVVPGADIGSPIRSPRRQVQESG